MLLFGCKCLINDPIDAVPFLFYQEHRTTVFYWGPCPNMQGISEDCFTFHQSHFLVFEFSTTYFLLMLSCLNIRRNYQLSPPTVSS
jgi:hypothetical protein